MNLEDFAPTEVAMRRYPGLAGLTALVQAGWTFIERADDRGLTRLDGFRSYHDGSVDAIAIRSDTDVLGLRTLGDRTDSVWHMTGTLQDVVDGLLQLPAPGTPGAPRLVIGRAPTLRM